jgi:hypothetical protein
VPPERADVRQRALGDLVLMGVDGMSMRSMREVPIKLENLRQKFPPLALVIDHAIGGEASEASPAAAAASGSRDHFGDTDATPQASKPSFQPGHPAAAGQQWIGGVSRTAEAGSSHRALDGAPVGPRSQHFAGRVSPPA